MAFYFHKAYSPEIEQLLRHYCRTYPKKTVDVLRQ